MHRVSAIVVNITDLLTLWTGVGPIAEAISVGHRPVCLVITTTAKIKLFRRQNGLETLDI